MPLAYEIREANQVLVCILHTDFTSIAWSLGLRNLKIPGRDELRTFYPIFPIAGMPFDNARNVCVEQMLRCGAEYVFFLDSDVIPPHDAILRLLAHNLPVVSGMYCRRSPPHMVPVMIKNGQWVTNFPQGALIEVDLVGAGCFLVHRSVFQSVPPQRPGKPWFDWKVDMQGILPKEECLSEDFTFNLHCRRHGIPVMVDTSVVCRHIGLAQATYGQFVPCDVMQMN